jgi:uncharacterized protein (TIGR03437 family)
MHNSVYAIDADDATSNIPLWRANLGTSVPWVLANYEDVQPEVGILSTPVIDPDRGVIYVVSETFEGGAVNFYVHALDLATGAEMLNGPSLVTASVPGNADDNLNGNIVFDPLQYLQRPGLLLWGGNLYVAFGSHGDEGPWHGWLLGYDASNLQRKVAVFNTTPNGQGGSFWQSGRGPAADSASIYAGSANGDYDGAGNVANSFLKLSSALQLQDWFTPQDWQILSDSDDDVASGGAILIPGTDLILGGDKVGTLYLMHGRGMANAAQTFTVVENSGIFGYAVWPRPGGALVYVQVSREFLYAYRIVDGQLDENPVAVSTDSSTSIPYNGFAISSNGTDDGILWTTRAPGALHAYDALTLDELWNSDLVPDRDGLGAFAKFATPTVAAGKVFVPTFANHLTIYGLLPNAAPAGPQIVRVANAASFVGDAVSAGEQLIVSGLQFQSDSGDTQVLFDGVPVPLLSGDAQQLAVLAPATFTGRATLVTVLAGGVTSNAMKMPVLPATPGVYTADGSGAGQAQAYNEDGSTNSSDNPADLGSMVTLVVNGAGVGANSISVTVNGAPADVLVAGAVDGVAQGAIGIMILVPGYIEVGDAQVTVKIAGYASQAGVSIALQ